MRSSRRMYQWMESFRSNIILAMAVAQLPPPMMAMVPQFPIFSGCYILAIHSATSLTDGFFDVEFVFLDDLSHLLL